MCKFFSLISDGNGKPYYFDWKQRQSILKKDPEFNMVETADSHSSISSYYGFTGEKADKVNKFEYNPLTKVFTIDQINTTDDKCLIEKFCREVNFKTIIEPLIIKPIIHPLKDIKAKKVTKKDLLLLKEWSSVFDSVWASVGSSVRDSVWAYVGSSVETSVWKSVGSSVWDYVRDSVGDSVRVSVDASVLDSVWSAVWSSVRDYVWDSVSTYFDIPYKHNFGVSQKLLERGFVPSCDGKKWRLHAGKNAKIVWEGTVQDLNKV
jgi:hypothetical protein